LVSRPRIEAAGRVQVAHLTLFGSRLNDVEFPS